MCSASACPATKASNPVTLYDRKRFETEYEALCVKEKVGVISYYSAKAGFLTGKYRSAVKPRKTGRVAAR